jgi:subtilase family serine protease
MLFRSALRLRPAISTTLLASLLLAVPAAALAQLPSKAIATLHPAAQHDRIAAHPDFAPLTQLDHQLPGWLQGRPQSSAHAVDLSTPIHVSLVLNRDPAVQTAFEQLLADQQTPSSPFYHQWLTPQQVGLFGPTAGDLAALTSWLTSQGLKVDSIAPSGVIVHASGSAAVVGNAFHTSFAMFSPDEGFTAAPRLSAVSEPSIPSALTPLVRSIQGLGEPVVKPLNFARAVKGTPRSAAGSTTGVRPMFTNGTPPNAEYFLTPGDFAVIFDINTVYSGGNTGATVGTKAQRIAVIGESRVTDTDVTDFETITGLPSTVPTVVIPTGATDPGTTATGAQDEATLDVDRVIATATGAGVDLVVAKNSATEGGIFIAAEYNVNTLLDPVMTISFGGCESQNGLSNTDFVDTLASTAAAEGITTLVSSGDSGAAGCDTSFTAAPATQIASINFICSSTYVTCVGGTEFNDFADPETYWSSTNSSTLVSALSYIPEGGWNEPSTTTTSGSTTTTTYAPAASGGGESIYIAKPSWQTGTGVPSGSFRYVPDVSLPAAGHDGYFACLAYNGGNCEDNYFEVFSGTSASAPGFAGIVALINTKVGTSAGNINPLLYELAASTPAAFHDTTVTTSGVTGCVATTPSMCNNSTPATSALTGGLSGYLLTTGYDEVTGLGSVDVNNLVTAAGAGAAMPISTTLTLTPPAAITAGNSSTFTVTLTPAAGSTATPTGSVQFYSNGTAIGSAVQLVSSTITSAPQTYPTAGTYTITAKYSGDGLFAAATAPGVSLVVNAAVTSGSFTLTASPSALTVSPVSSNNGTPNTGTVTSAIAATPTDSFAGIVALTCAISPSTTVPPTCLVSPTSVNVTATATSTLTISYVGSTTNCVTNGEATPSSIRAAYFGPAAFALLLLLLPFRKRKSIRNLACIVLLITGIATLNGCGGNSSTGGGGACSNVISGGTTPGSYTVTVTGTSGSITQTATVALTVN